MFIHRGPAQAASLVVCSKYEEMYGKILESYYRKIISRNV